MCRQGKAENSKCGHDRPQHSIDFLHFPTPSEHCSANLRTKIHHNEIHPSTGNIKPSCNEDSVIWAPELVTATPSAARLRSASFVVWFPACCRHADLGDCSGKLAGVFRSSANAQPLVAAPPTPRLDPAPHLHSSSSSRPSPHLPRPPAATPRASDRAGRAPAIPQPWFAPEHPSPAVDRAAAARESRDRHREKSSDPHPEKLSSQCLALPSPRRRRCPSRAAAPPSTRAPWDAPRLATPLPSHRARECAPKYLFR